MNPADKRLSDLLDKWQSSLELHLRYASLDEAAYQRVQAWPPHDRPTRWVIELALQKLAQLREAHAARMDRGDGEFADALEQMSFLTNLVGVQHIRRFIPLADPRAASPAGDTTVQVAPDEGTREMARPKPARSRGATGTHRRPAPGGREVSAADRQRVIDDAKRLLGWGRKWHELAELISRMAGRPSTAEVRRILREHKDGIEAG